MLRLRTSDGVQFDGRIVQESLGDDPAVVLFAVDGSSDEPLIVPLEHIASIEER